MENWKRLTHLFVTVFLSYFSDLLVNPAIPDVTLSAVCPGQDECSAAIYLTGFQQAIAGIGSVIMMPLLGNLSDSYGRKALMSVPMILSIFPFVVLALRRTTAFFYTYYAIKTVTTMVTQGGVVCLALAYLADTVPEDMRISAFGILSGVVSAAFLGGTFTARLLSTACVFQVAAAVSIIAVIYMSVFLEEPTRKTSTLEEPILNSTQNNENNCKASKRAHAVGKIPYPQDIYCLLKSSITFSLAAFVAFFNSLAEAGLNSCLLYFLKARFHFNKNQFADVLLIAYIGATISNMVFMPTLGPYIGEETLLSMGLFAGFLNMFFDSIAWAPWVPYASASMGIFLFLGSPTLRSIVSKQVGSNEQGLAQGCILGITAFANVISPLIYSPLSALFLSKDEAPFHFQGFSILCIGLAWLVGFFLSVLIPLLPKKKTHREDCVVA